MEIGQLYKAEVLLLGLVEVSQNKDSNIGVFLTLFFGSFYHRIVFVEDGLDAFC